MSVVSQHTSHRGEILTIVLINGHEGFISHLLLLELSHDSASMDFAEVKLELCVM